MNGPLIARALDHEIAQLALRREGREEGRALYHTLAQESPGGAWVARDEGGVVGSAFLTGSPDERYVSELFVEPGFRRRGLGTKLLAAATGDASLSLMGCVGAAQYAGLGFAARRGDAVHTPILDLAGTLPRMETLAKMAVGTYRFRTATIDALAHGGVLDALDREVRGYAVADQHAYFAGRATGTLFELDGEAVGYTYVWPSGRLGPQVIVSSAYAVQLLGFGLATLAATYAAAWCTMLVPSANTRVASTALRLGLDVQTTRLLAGTAVADPSRSIGFHHLWF